MNKKIKIMVVLTTCLALAACAPAKDKKESAVSTSQEPSQKQSETSGGSNKNEGILRLGVKATVDCIGYPGKLLTTTEQTVAAISMETLCRFDEDGELVPFLLESMEEDTELPGLVLHIREGIQFHDNTPLNADAVIYNLQNTIEAKNKVYPCGELKFEKSDDYTVKVIMPTWDNSVAPSLLTQDCGFMASPDYLKSISSPTDAYFNPVGTGAYKLVSYDTGAKLVYECNPEYWGEEPLLKEMQIHFFMDSASICAAMQSQEIDGIIAADADTTMNMQSVGYTCMGNNLSTGNTIRFLAMTSKAGSDCPLTDIKVRKAVAHAVDLKALADRYNGRGNFIYTNQWAAPGSWAYSDEVVGYEFNPEKSKELLKEAGYENGFTMDAYVVSTQNDNIADIEMIQSYLSDVGINLNINLIEQTVMNEITMTGWNGLSTGTQNGSLYQISSSIGKIFNYNISKTRYSCDFLEIPELYDMAEAAAKFPKPSDGAEVVHKMQKMIVDEQCVFLPYLSSSWNFFMDEKVGDTNFGTCHMVQWTPEKAYVK